MSERFEENSGSVPFLRRRFLDEVRFHFNESSEFHNSQRARFRAFRRLLLLLFIVVFGLLACPRQNTRGLPPGGHLTAANARETPAAACADLLFPFL